MKKIMKPLEVAITFGYSMKHIYDLCKMGRLDAVRNEKGHWQIPRDSVLEYTRQRKATKPPVKGYMGKQMVRKIT